jgi:uncharacterized membrane protein YphA (DoxX/SURF4 family)
VGIHHAKRFDVAEILYQHCVKKFLVGYLALLALAAEFLGPLGLAVGLLTRAAAFGIFCVMLVAIITTHGRHGLFMNWYGNQKGVVSINSVDEKAKQ